MARLELIFLFALLFEVGNSQEQLYRFYLPDQNVSLPCRAQNRSEQCSRTSWLYNGDSPETVSVAMRGKIEETSPRADRLSLNTDCSLDIKHIKAEDVGLYTCRLYNTDYYDVHVYLSVLTVSQLPADSDQTRNSEVTLECSLLRYDDGRPCRSNGLRWVDETGTEVTEGVNKFSRNADCISHLKVKTERGDNRKVTCKFVQKDKVEIQADYPHVLTASLWSSLSYVMPALRLSALILMIVTTVLVFSLRGYIKPLHKGNKVHEDDDEDVIELTYENVEARPPAAEEH